MRSALGGAGPYAEPLYQLANINHDSPQLWDAGYPRVADRAIAAYGGLAGILSEA